MRTFVPYLAALLFALPGTASADTFNEVGDAGQPADPMHVGPEGVLFEAIAGNLGDNGDTSDAFLFYFGGGDITFAGLIGDPAFPPEPVHLGLFYPPDPVHPPEPVTPTATNADTLAITFANLAAGNYILEATISGGDPPYIITFVNPDTGAPLTISAPVPEPGTVALLAVGVLALAFLRRRRG